MTHTNRLIRALRDNGYHQSRFEGRLHFSKARDRRELSLTILGNGWVSVYQRECPSSEGWAIYNCRASEARDLVGWV